DIVLVDITMGGISGLDVIKSTKKHYPNTGFITLTMHDEGQYVTKAVRSGASGYLLKNADEEQVIEAILKVHQGGKYFPADVSQLMIESITMEGDVKQLSQREKEVLEKVAEGKTTKEIADELIVSTRTVETHRANMMKKLDVQNSAELIKKATKLNII
ncbi:MAG: response regulator transcription factor, partial [Ekhidna sp.]|nr:response regulator transcription factor [Ekhidna sp.]